MLEEPSPEGPPPHVNQQRRQPPAVRARLIRHNRFLRNTRKRKLHLDRNLATARQAANSLNPVAAAPHGGIGRGHRTFTIGPILFCKICGATKTFSGGGRLARPCRGWAPKRTLATTRARLQGRNYAFYRDLVLHSATVHPTGDYDSLSRLPTNTVSSPSCTPTHTTRPPTPIRLARVPVLNAHLDIHTEDNTYPTPLADDEPPVSRLGLSEQDVYSHP